MGGVKTPFNEGVVKSPYNKGVLKPLFTSGVLKALITSPFNRGVFKALLTGGVKSPVNKCDVKSTFTDIMHLFDVDVYLTHYASTTTVKLPLKTLTVRLVKTVHHYYQSTSIHQHEKNLNMLLVQHMSTSQHIMIHQLTLI